MSLYDNERRYRRRFWGGVVRFVITIGVIAASAVAAYQLGIEDLESRVRGYQQEISDLEARQDRLEQENADLRVVAEKAKLTVGEWERRYRADVPDGVRKELLDLVTRRLEDGVSGQRLAFLIEAAAEPRDCAPVESKRFLVRTPLYNGPNTVVSFANDAVVVTGEGESETTADGLPQAWYDPLKPVTLKITRIDGEVREVTGNLPLQESVIHAGAEFRFQVKAGARGFAQVAAEQCAYP